MIEFTRLIARLIRLKNYIVSKYFYGVVEYDDEEEKSGGGYIDDDEYTDMKLIESEYACMNVYSELDPVYVNVLAFRY
jgi:hypothetical protein